MLAFREETLIQAFAGKTLPLRSAVSSMENRLARLIERSLLWRWEHLSRFPCSAGTFDGGGKCARVTRRHQPSALIVFDHLRQPPDAGSHHGDAVRHGLQRGQTPGFPNAKA